MNRESNPADVELDHVFRTTHWSVVIGAGGQDSPEAQQALARLCQTYWMPVYGFVRRRGHRPEEAMDLVQDFFEGFIQKNTVTRAVRERGRFRSFLMTAVENYLRNAHERSQAQKRGGGSTFVPLEDLDPEEAYLSDAPASPGDPAGDFDLRWALTVLQQVMKRLHDEQHEAGRGTLFEVLQGHLWGDADSPAYSELAAKFDLTVASIKVTAHRLRRRYRELLREEIAQTVAHPGQIDEELRHLMQIVSR